LLNKFLFLYYKNIKIKLLISFLNGDWGLGIGDWGLGFGANTQNPKTQTPNPKPQKIINFKKF